MGKAETSRREEDAPNEGPPLLTGWDELDQQVEADLRALKDGGSLSVVVAFLEDLRLLSGLVDPDIWEDVGERFHALLREVSGRRGHARGGRYAVSLPGWSARDAAVLAQRVRSGAERIPTALGGLRVSAGAAVYPGGAAGAAELVYGAQAAMHWARATGGIRAGSWSEMTGAADGPGGPRDPVTALVTALEWKTDMEPGQAARSAWYARRVAEMLGLSRAEQELTEKAALLHDIGKLAIDDVVLTKPAPLSDEEKALVKRHPLVTADILARIPSLAPAVPVVLHHHEHFDGSGYPDALGGPDIPIGSRIILVADAFEAMTTHRAYRTAFSLQSAVQELRRCAGQQFDPAVVEAFARIVDAQGLKALHWSHLSQPRTRRP